MTVRSTILVFLISFVLIFSCSTKKDIIYLHNSSDSISTDIKFDNYLIKSGDILRIRLVAASLELSQTSNFDKNQNRESLILDGFHVDSDGFITYPQIGKVYIQGSTISEAESLIFKKLFEKQIVTDYSNLKVTLLNSSFSILGEVNNPGKYYFDEINKLSLIQAISMAGDLTITGKRKDVKLIRFIDNKYITHKIDLTSDDFLTNKNHQIFSGDIIIVNPNTNRVKNAGIIGNSGTLLSLLSFLLSSIIIISR